MGVKVQERLHGCFDLVAAEAVYHNHCYSRFMLNKQIDKSKSKQVDILISKNQALQILYLTHRVYNETTY